jgi:hypothetical protein
MSRSLHLEYITQEGEIIKNLNKGEFYKYLGINQSNHIQHSIIKENLEKQFYSRIKSILKSKLNGNNLIKAVNTYAVPLLTYSFGVIKWSKTNLQNINIKTRVLFTKFSKHHPKSAIERFNLPRENGGRGFSNLEILLKNQIASLKNYFLNRARDNTFFNALVLADKGYTPLNLSDNIISDIVKPNIPDTIANIKQKSTWEIQSDQQETKSRVLLHLLFYRNVFLSWISRFYLLAVDTRFVGCLPLKNLSLIAFINFL